MMLLFSPCKRCPCPCSDAVLRSCEEALAGIILHRPPSLWIVWVRSGCAGPVGAAVRGRGAGRGGGGYHGGGGGCGGPGPESIYACVCVCVCVFPQDTHELLEHIFTLWEFRVVRLSGARYWAQQSRILVTPAIRLGSSDCAWCTLGKPENAWQTRLARVQDSVP